MDRYLSDCDEYDIQELFIEFKKKGWVSKDTEELGVFLICLYRDSLLDEMKLNHFMKVMGNYSLEQIEAALVG